jgi:DNA-directed RNA polymerase specialized sigma24 family protein
MAAPARPESWQLAQPRRYLLSLRLSPETAEDLVHETFLRLHRALGEKKVRTDFVRAWLFRVTHNLASLKRKSGEVSLSADELISLADICESGGDPETAVLHEEWVLRLHRPPGYPTHSLRQHRQQP